MRCCGPWFTGREDTSTLALSLMGQPFAYKKPDDLAINRGFVKADDNVCQLYTGLANDAA